MHKSHTDLCSTCTHVRTCGSRGTSATPIFSCDKYCALAAAEPTRMLDLTSSIVPGHGLCFSCRVRETCHFPRPEGGVWHCEEYV